MDRSEGNAVNAPSTDPDPVPGVGPVIPPPPANPGRRGKSSDVRALVWFVALLLGAALGVGAYGWVPGLNTYVDDWVALALG